MSTRSRKVVKEESGSLRREGRLLDRLPAYIHLVVERNGPKGDALDLASTVVRDHGTPLADGSGADVQRPRDIRGSLKVIENVRLEHEPSLTAVARKTQPQLCTGQLTSVDMKLELGKAADRLKLAMKDADVDRAELAHRCHVSLSAVGYWLNAQKLISPDKAELAARRLKVSADWLRLKSDSRERDGAPSQQALEQALDALNEMREPLRQLAEARAETQRAENALLQAIERIEQLSAPLRRLGGR